MEGINVLIDRVQKFGYQHIKGKFDDQDVPDNISKKTFYINFAPADDGSGQLPLDSTRNVKTIREQFTIFLIDLQKNVDLNQFVNDRNDVLAEILKNRGADKIEGVAKIEILNVRNGDTEQYLISQIGVAFTEIL